MHILTAPENLPFVIALALVLGLAGLQMVAVLMGGAGLEPGHDGQDGLSLDHAAGDAGVQIDHDGPDLDGGHDGLLGEALHWLHFGQIPFTILLILFLLNFGITGLALQTAIQSMAGAYMPMPLALGISLLIALPGLRLSGSLLKPVLPREETEAVSHDSFIGCDAQITTGTARHGRPAEARLRDSFGRTHYVMVEPEDEDAAFAAGSHVLLLKREGAVYRVMDNSSAVIDI